MAIVGIGTDIVDIRRIERLIEKSDRFAQRVLSDSEYQIYQQHSFPAAYLAKRFAAKEAVAKALGTGISGGMRFEQISVESLPSGQPTLTFHAATLDVVEKLGVTNSFVSLSDEKDYAVATVVLES